MVRRRRRQGRQRRHRARRDARGRETRQLIADTAAALGGGSFTATYRGIRPPRSADLGRTGRVSEPLLDDVRRVAEPLVKICRVSEPRRRTGVSKPRRRQLRLEGLGRLRGRLLSPERRRGRGAVLLLPAEPAGEGRRGEGVVVVVADVNVRSTDDL